MLLYTYELMIKLLIYSNCLIIYKSFINVLVKILFKNMLLIILITNKMLLQNQSYMFKKFNNF